MAPKLNDLRKRIYLNLKEKAYSLEGEVTSELRAYRKDQVKSSTRPFQPSSIEELKDSVTRSQVIYFGDFHTFDQNIRNVLRILKFIASNEENCVIGLEMVDAKYQFCLDAYMEGHLTELEFLESIDYNDSWRFPWTHYKLIFELAKEHRIRMIALNAKGSLKERDLFAADVLASNLKKGEDAKFIVVYGELHITKNKIPALVSQRAPDTRQTIIHQNLDEVYWSMKGDGEDEKIVKFGPEEFCINSAPPWVKYESMIYWYENLDSDPDFDIHEYIIENGKKIFSDDTYENFLTISMELSNAVKLDLAPEELESFNLRDHTGLDFIEEKIEALEDSKLQDYYKNLIAKGHSFRLAGEDTFYCSSYSMNRISYLSGIHLYHTWNRVKNQREDAQLEAKDKETLFYRTTIESMHAFFFSKIMNPHRKCDMYWNLKNTASAESGEQALAAQTAIQALDGKPLASLTEANSHLIVHFSGEMAGHILGEYLYLKVFSNERLQSFEREFMSARFDRKSFLSIRDNLLSETNYAFHKKRFF